MSLSAQARPGHIVEDRRSPRGRVHDELRAIERRIREMRAAVTLLEDQRERLQMQLRRT